MSGFGVVLFCCTCHGVTKLTDAEYGIVKDWMENRIGVVFFFCFCFLYII